MSLWPVFRDFAQAELAFRLLVASVILLATLAFLFAVYALVLRYRNARKRAHLDLLEASWTPVLMHVLQGRYPPEALWERVGAEEHLAFVRFILRYVRRVRGGQRQILRGVVEPFLPDVATGLTKGTVEERALVVQTLGTLGLPRFEADVVRALDDPSPLVAMVAARSLARPDHPQHIGVVIDHLERFGSWSRGFLGAMLAAIGPEGAETLRTTFEDPSRPGWIRTVAADALRWLNDVNAAEVAARVVSCETDRDLLVQALKLLERLGNEEHAPVVRKLAYAPDPVIRANALRTLGRIGDEGDGELLRDGLFDPSSWVVLQSVRSLARMGRWSTLQSLATSEHPRALFAQQVLEERGRHAWAR